MRSSRLKQRSSAVRNSTALKEDLWEDAVEGSAASIMSAMAASVQQRGSVCREFPQQVGFQTLNPNKVLSRGGACAGSFLSRGGFLNPKLSRSRRSCLDILAPTLYRESQTLKP
jgi:hypothetical protein